MTATYIKLQDAYASEANKAGTWKNIGYVAPGATAAGSSGTTTNFSYSGSIAADVNISSTMQDQAQAWLADNLVALNDCAAQTTTTAAGANWKIQVKAATNGNSILYSATTNCTQLTPTFANMTSQGW